MLNNSHSFLCAQTGLGKTFISITAAIHEIIRHPEQNIHVILMLPNAAVKSFTDTIQNILGLPYDIFTPTSTKMMEGSRFHIFTYSSITKDVMTRVKRDTFVRSGTNPYFERMLNIKKQNPNLILIADEAHVMQDTNTLQYAFMKEIRTMFRTMWFLTATPILNDIDGFYYMNELIRPGFWGNIWQFRANYTVTQPTSYFIYDKKQRRRVEKTASEVIGYKNLDILEQRFNEIAIIRSIEYDLNFIYKSTTMSDHFNKMYTLAAEGLFSGTVKPTTKEGKNKDGEAVTHGARLHDLQRVVSNSHKDFKYPDPTDLTDKEVLLIKTIQEVISRNESMLIYFTYRDTLERVKELLKLAQGQLHIPKIHEIHGDIKPAARKAVEKNIKPRDVVLITSAGTESVNLQKANNLIFYEVPFALRHFIQACGRITRTDTKHSTFNAYILEVEDTIDTYKKNRIIANSGVIKSVLGGSNALPTSMLNIRLEDIQQMKNEYLWRK